MHIINVLKTDFGSIIISILLGLGLASLFRKTCSENNCIVIKGPPIEKIKNKTFKFDDKCYKYEPEITSCKNKN